MPNNLEIADVFREYGDDYRRRNLLPLNHLKVMQAIENCRTASLGGHVLQCDCCHYEINLYNSCRNRHCPKCQTLTKEKWLNKRRVELLPTGYFHLVFTLPHELNPIILQNKQVLLSMLFSSVSETLNAFAKDPRWRLCGQLGFIAVLHTWSQTLLDHFHLHCLIPAGVFSFKKDRWIPSRKTYLFKVESLAMAFGNCYLRNLKQSYLNGDLQFSGRTAHLMDKSEFSRITRQLTEKKWIAYAKKPFGGPEQVLNYLGRYTHRVAISNHRILSMENGKIAFTYKDRSKNDEIKTMTLDSGEFIRRFLLHVLPEGFMKIRYFGFLAHRNKKESIPIIRALIDKYAVAPIYEEESIAEMLARLTGTDINKCPKCKKGTMREIALIPRMGILLNDSS